MAQDSVPHVGIVSFAQLRYEIVHSLCNTALCNDIINYTDIYSSPSHWATSSLHVYCPITTWPELSSKRLPLAAETPLYDVQLRPKNVACFSHIQNVPVPKELHYISLSLIHI